MELPHNQGNPAHAKDYVSFERPWSSPYRVDPRYMHHLVNDEGNHLFIANKTAWAYFVCHDPLEVVRRARSQGINVLRVTLEGRFFGCDLWPWGGTREEPDWHTFHSAYWDEVERRVRLAGDHGIGLDLVLYFTIRPDKRQLAEHIPYWRQVIGRLSKYSNILTWEVANEYTGNETFQDEAGGFFKREDPFGRPVCTSEVTTDDAIWPDKPWVDLAINHSCTSSTDTHHLKRWYLAVALNTRSHGKPSFCNESGREFRHKNDDPVHRRKQGWIWCSTGGYWTYHSREGCEGIDEPSYRGPGVEFMRPMTEYFQRMPFWRMNPNYSIFQIEHSSVLCVSLSELSRRTTSAYICTYETGSAMDELEATIRLLDGEYTLQFIDPSCGSVMETRQLSSGGLGNPVVLALPPFLDDLAVLVQQQVRKERTEMEGTQ